MPSSLHFAKKPSKGIEAVWKSFLTLAQQTIACREQLDESMTEADKPEDKAEEQPGSAKIGYYEWQNCSAAQRCLAGNDEHEPEDEGDGDQEPEDEGDTGIVDEDLPICACVHCGFSTQIRYLSQCDDCHQFACIRCIGGHRCGPQGGDDDKDRLGSSRLQEARSSRDRSPRRDERLGGASSASSASSSRLVPAVYQQFGGIRCYRC